MTWEQKKTTTLRIGTRVKLSDGNEGTIVANTRLTKYLIQVDGSEKPWTFEAKYVEELILPAK